MPKVKLVTFTGADDNVRPEEILRLAESSPIQTEWALLMSKKKEGTACYPSSDWTLALINQIVSIVDKATLAGHLCGQWLRAMCEGAFAFPEERPAIWPYLPRIQLNFCKERFSDENLIPELHNPFKQFIFQMDGVNERLYHRAVKYKFNAVPLFDLSGGNGILPLKWPAGVNPTLNGYAGGLSPDNLKEQLPLIAEAAGDVPFWIDLQSGLRTNDRFDLDKCRRVLDIVGEFNDK